MSLQKYFSEKDGFFDSVVEMLDSKPLLKTFTAAKIDGSALFFSVDNSDLGGGQQYANGLWANPLKTGPDTEVLTFTGGGTMELGRINELQDGNASYKLPLASSGSANQYLDVTQSLPYASLSPVVSAETGDTIVNEDGVISNVVFDQELSITARLTTDGISQWRLTI